jgi:catechol 2,3-dioxygenase-like lactoylglutathione lyase family enzyme
VNVQKISAVTFLVASMPASVRFYRDLLGMEVIYGGENGYFSSLRTKDGKDPIHNLEHGNPATQWGRLISATITNSAGDCNPSWTRFAACTKWTSGWRLSHS